MPEVHGAEMLLKEKAFQEAVSSLKHQYMNSWSLTGIDQTEERETLYLKLRTVDEVVGQLQALVDTIEFGE